MPLTFTSSNTNVAIIVNGKIHIKRPGVTNITASQPGNNQYKQATEVVQLLKVIYARTPAVTWQKSAINNLESLDAIADYGYIGLFDTTINYHGVKYRVIKFDSTFKVQWQTFIDTNFVGGTVRQTADKGYIITGSFITQANIYKPDGEVIRLDSAGKIKWRKKYGGTDYDGLRYCEEMPDGTFVLVGGSSSPDGDGEGNNGAGDAWVIKIDENGDVLWKNSYGTLKNENGMVIKATPDGGFIIAGTSPRLNTTDALYAVWLVKISADGNIQWQYTYGGGYLCDVASLSLTNDGGYIVTAGIFNTGDTTGSDVHGFHGGFDYWVLKLDSTGKLQWQKCLGGTGNDQPWAILQAPDGGYLVGGTTDSEDGDIFNNNGSADYWVIKLALDGEIIWTKCLGNVYWDGLRALINIGNEKYIAGGIGQDPYSFRGAIYQITDTLKTYQQKITLPAIPVKHITDEDFTPGAFINTGRPLSFTSSDTTVASIVNGKVHIKKAGATFITALQNGDSLYYAAKPQRQALIVSSPLPVTFQNFTAQKQQSNALLTWQTATELNSKQFNVQRSLDGTMFTNIGTVKAAGSSTVLRQYNFIDNAALKISVPMLYYRIQEVDNDGRKNYSKVATLALDNSKAYFIIAPNPVHSSINIRSTANAKAMVRITDMAGRVLYSSAASFAAGGITSVPAARLARGMYIVTIQGNNVSAGLKVVKE